MHVSGSRRAQSGRTWSARLAARNPVRRSRILQRIRADVQQRGFGLDPAPLSALDLLSRVGGSRPDAEAAAFAELAVGEVSRARVEVERRAAILGRLTLPDAEPGPLQRLGILGAGVMGAELAVAAANARISVRIREKEPAALSRALQRVGAAFDRGGPSRGSAAGFRARARVSGGLDLRGFETMDLVLEAVPEDLALKRAVLAELEVNIAEDAVIATHPRALPVREIGARLGRRSRLVGLRFFPPVAKMPLCEVVRTPETSPRAMATALAFVRAVGKTPVVVRDGPGFFTTRVLAFYLHAAIDMVASGYRIEDIDLGARRAGWPVGPLQLLDDVGLDVAISVAHLLRDAFGPRLSVPPGLQAMVAAGRTGAASGRGFWLRSRSAPMRPDPDAYASMGAAGSRTADPDELGDRLTLVAALEAVRCLQDEVIADPRDGNVAAVLGIGYPAQRGGPFRHLAARGLASTRARLAALEDRFGNQYSAPPLLVELARSGSDFAAMEGRA
jgi:3-hydroxyacyl-CoA dehydrogenase/enoyl-CoA hydratase/3-hydroxybutyryl-CoA epimerase